MATINVGAAKGTPGLEVGRRVRIAGAGPFSGETATIKKLISGVIAQAIVTTDDGNSRRVRTIDLEPIAGLDPASPPPTDGRASA